MSSAAELTVIIPSWNQRELLRNCLESLNRQTVPSQILVVDDGSTDGTEDLVAEERNRFTTPLGYTRLEKRLGFAAAVNHGIRQSRTPFLALLNNDTEADPHWAEQGLQALLQQPDYSFFASRILSLREKGRLDSAGDCYDRLGIPYPRGRDEPAEQYGEPQAVLGASAGGAFYRRELFDQIGFFDESFHMYLEDVDLSLRAQLHGHRCLYLPDAVVHHLEGASQTSSDRNSTETNPARAYWITRNRWQLMVTYQPFRHFPWLIYGWGRSLVSTMMKRGDLSAFLRGLSAGIRATPSALRKRTDLQKTRTLPPEQFYRLLTGCTRG